MEGLWWRAAVEASKAVALRGYNVMVAPCELLGGTPKASFSWRSESWGSDGSSGSLCPCNPCTVITAACWHLMLARSAEGLWTAEILLLAWSRIRKLPGLLLSHIPPLRRCRRSWMWSQACMTGQLDGSPPRLQLREVYPDQTWQKVSLKKPLAADSCLHRDFRWHVSWSCLWKVMQVKLAAFLLLFSGEGEKQFASFSYQPFTDMRTVTTHLSVAF